MLGINLMEINKLADLNSLRTAPLLSSIQEKKLLGELESNIYNADWITIGIMAPSDTKAIEALKSINLVISIQFILIKIIFNQRFFHSKPT